MAQTRLTKSEGAAPGTAFGSHFDLAASTRCVRRCGVPNKTSLVNQPDDDPGDSSHEDIAGEQRPRRKSAQLFFVVAIEAGKLLLDIRQNRRSRARGRAAAAAGLRSDQYGPGLQRRFRPALKTLSVALMLTGIGKAPAVVTSVVD